MKKSKKKPAKPQKKPVKKVSKKASATKAKKKVAKNSIPVKAKKKTVKKVSAPKAKAKPIKKSVAKKPVPKPIGQKSIQLKPQLETNNAILSTPDFTKSDLETLKKYFELNKKYQKKISDELMPEVLKHPLFGKLLKQQTEEKRKAQQERSLEMQRSAIYDGKWEEYAKDLMTQGVMYARMNISYKDWYKLIKIYKDHLIPHLKKDFVGSTEEAITFIDGLSKFVDYAMYGIAEAYFTEKNTIIKAQEENFRAIFENSADHILLIDKNANIITINRVTPDYKKEDVIGKSLFSFPDEKNHEMLKKAINTVLTNKTPFVFETSVLVEGVSKYVSSSISPIFGMDGEINNLVFISRDINEQKIAEEKIKEMNANLEKKVNERTEELKTSNNELEQFAYVASHDLQEPLRTISNFTGLFEQQYKGKLDKKADEYLNFISSSTARMQILIKDLLEYSRIGKNDIDKTEVDCNELLKEVLNDLSKSTNESKAEIHSEYLPTMKGYPMELKSLFQNLISNAIKFQKGDGHPIINISVKDKNTKWLFAVKDNGIGIDRKYYDKLFIIFQRLHNKTEYPGTGIGLVQCRKIVELHGGKIWVDSELGKGSTFYFTLPKTI
jgi:PAS domain S-box-containing protein